MSTAAYRIEMDLFSGPVDLLLYLVRRSELNAGALTLSRLTVQFRETIDALELIGEELNIELAGDFVVTMATLIEIKGRQTLPQETETERPEAAPIESEPSDDLVARLLQFKRFRDAAVVLGRRADDQSRRYARMASDRPVSANDPTQDRIRGIEIWDLLSAFSRIAATQLDRGVETIRDEEVPVHVYVEQVSEYVLKAGRATFSELFAGERKRSRIVGVFLAILELVRHHRFVATQDAQGGEITITPPPAELEDWQK